MERLQRPAGDHPWASGTGGGSAAVGGPEFAQTVMLIQRNASMFHVAQARGLAHAKRMFTMAVQAEVLCTALGCAGKQAAVARDAWSAWNAARRSRAAH